KHSDCHGTDASWHRCNGPGYLLGRIKVYISLQDRYRLAGFLAYLFADPVDTDIDDTGTGLYPLRLHKARHACGNNKDVSALAVGFEIFRSGMHNGDCGVGAPAFLEHDHCYGLSDYVRASNDNDFGA